VEDGNSSNPERDAGIDALLFVVRAPDEERETLMHDGKNGSKVLKNENEVAKLAKLKNKDYERELRKLQVQLVEMQEWVKATGARVVVIFEGRDAAGKGGVIHRIMERVSPRVFHHVALPAPTEREKTQMYAQRYMAHLPAAGEVVIFDRSWYNRALVERVMEFCTAKQCEDFLRMCPRFETLIQSQGVILVKYWFEVSEKEQHRRFLKRIEDPMRRWKLSPMDLESHRRWFDYSRARDEMFAATDTPQSPWYVVRTDDKKRARLNCIAHLLTVIKWERIPLPKITLPDRQKAQGYKEAAWDYRWIPEKY
jgi:polyphosphate kinase 2